MTESEDNQDNEVEVEPVYDPEGYVQQRRLKDIFDAKKKVRERRLSAKKYNLEHGEKKGSLDAVRMYRSAVENYLSELKPLFLEEQKGQHYWHKEKIGTLNVQLPVNQKTTSRGTIYKYGDTRITSPPEPKEWELVGVGCLFHIDEPLVAEFDVMKKTGLSRSRRVTVKHEAAIPFAHLDQIMNLANQYLSERGMELDPEDDTDPASI